MTWLDIGCGGMPKGTVNLDLFQGESPHTSQLIDPKEIDNFTNGSAGFLPYRDKSCRIVSGYHLIEHSLNPTIWLADMARVCKKYLVIVVPNHPRMMEHHTHYYSWSKKSLENLLSEYGKVVYSKTRLMWWNSDRLLKAISKVPFLMVRRRIYQLLDFLFGMEIVVMVDITRGKQNGN